MYLSGLPDGWPKWHPPLGTWTWLEKLDPEAVEVDADALTSDIARAFHHKLDAKSIEPEALAAALEKYGVVDRTVICGGLQFLARLKEIRPSIRRMPPLGDLRALGAIARSIEPYAFDVRWEILSRVPPDCSPPVHPVPRRRLHSTPL